MARHIKIYHSNLTPISTKKQIEKKGQKIKIKNTQIKEKPYEEQSFRYVLNENKKQDKKQEREQKIEEGKKLAKEHEPSKVRKSFRERRQEFLKQRPIIQKQIENDMEMRKQADLVQDIEHEKREAQEENDRLLAGALNEQELSLNVPIRGLEQLLLPRKSTESKQGR